MRIGIDMHVLQGMRQGSRTYLEGIYGELLRFPSAHQWHCMVNSTDAWSPPIVGKNIYWDEIGAHSRLGRFLYGLNRASRDGRLDCIHTTYVLPAKKRTKEVVTIHDTLFESHPEYFDLKKRMALKYIVKRSAQRADAITTISEFSKNEIATRYGIDPRKIFLTTCGFDSKIFKPGNPEESKEITNSTYGLDDFILTVGRLEPRKNFSNLIRAYSNLRQKDKHYPKLVIVGAKDFGTEEVMRCIKTYGVEQEVIHLENVSNENLAHLYRAARLFVFPSFAEGFGIPLVEAMACGCPIASSGTTAMKEVISDGCGVLFEPRDPDSIQAAMDRIIQNPEDAQRLVAAGYLAVTQFTWSRGAKVLLDVFDQLS